LTYRLTVYPYDGRLRTRPVSIRTLLAGVDVAVTVIPFPSHGRTLERPYPYYGTVRIPKPKISLNAFLQKNILETWLPQSKHLEEHRNQALGQDA